jgi:hypothetical protein
LGAIGVIRSKGFLGQNDEAGEQPQSLVEVEVVDVAVAFLVEEFEDQQAKQGADRGDHAGARVAGVVDEAVKAELGQQRQEQESASHTRVDGAFRAQSESTAIGDGRRLGTRRSVAGVGAYGTPARRGKEKGGT